MFCRALCQTGTYGKGREGTLPAGKQTAVGLCAWDTKKPSHKIPGYTNTHRHTDSFYYLLIFAPFREFKTSTFSFCLIFFLFFSKYSELEEVLPHRRTRNADDRTVLAPPCAHPSQRRWGDSEEAANALTPLTNQLNISLPNPEP